MKIALIGTGYWGKNLARNFSELGVLYCVCDHDTQSAHVIAKQHEVSVLSLDHIIQDKNILGVVIATPAATHYKFAKKALKAGKHVFVEKPMTLSLKHAQELCKIAEEMQKILMVGHLLHYHPVFIKLKEIVRNGVLGQIKYLYSHRLDLGIIYPKKDVLWNLAPHDLSMILSITEASPISITTKTSCSLRSEMPDFATIHMDFSNETQAHVFVSWLNPFKEHKLTVIGDKAMAVFEDSQREWSRKLAIYNHEVKMQSDEVITVKKDPVFINVEKSEPLKNECKHFIDCIQQNKVPITNGQEALRGIEILEKARASYLLAET
ncbi:MAG: Gfo/Idh/MocA family oxidoreductase [Rickettsiales bacterium]|nr:Gfo/Idh/MocA family oxidoreductase [Rickettsiales bacterium]